MNFFWAFQVLWFVAICNTINSKHLNILVFGGNGFIGSESVNYLIANGHIVTVLNRGSNYYDYDVRIKPYVNVIQCDRYKGLENCEELMKQNAKYDFIIDFSAYEQQVIYDALQNVKFDIYLFISTDSVYEVSKNSHNKYAREVDAQRPTSISEQEIVNKKDEYGHHKLLGEELLINKNKEIGLKYIILRLSDVFGPRDTTYRWWMLQTLLQFFPQNAVCLPNILQNLTTSYVYVKDVAKLISTVVKDVAKGNSKTLNQIYNVAYSTCLNVRTLLNSLQLSLGIKGVEYNYCENGIHLFPSVLRGPVDITKLQHSSLYEVTPWNQAVNETVEFFKEALCKFPTERTTMMKKMYSVVSQTNYPILIEKIQDYVKKCNTATEEKWHDEL